MSNPPKPFCKGDLLIYLVLLCATLVSLTAAAGFGVNTASVVRISTPDTEIVLPLSEPHTETIHANGYTLIAVIENGTVRVQSSDCPDGICMQSGTLHENGSIVCLPAGIIISIGHNGGGDADVIIG